LELPAPIEVRRPFNGAIGTSFQDVAVRWFLTVAGDWHLNVYTEQGCPAQRVVRVAVAKRRTVVLSDLNQGHVLEIGLRPHSQTDAGPQSCGDERKTRGDV